MRTTITKAAALAGPLLLAPLALADDEPAPRLSASFGVDVTNAYYFRGLRQEDDGLIVQPWVEASLRLHDWDGGELGFTVGLWNSIHGDTGTAASDSSTPNWYEADLYLGPTLTLGNVTLGATYTWYSSPSDAFDTIEELSFSAAYDDSEHGLLFGVALNPHATLAIELGDDAADGLDSGVYLELGVEPAITFDDGCLKGSTLAFPVTVGLSLDDYYESGTDSDVFGFFDAGARLDVPLPLDASWGSWTLSVGMHALVLGEAASDLNGGDDFEVIGTVGVSASF